MREMNYRHTIRACFTGYIVQAVVNNFIPLLFVYFHTHYHIPMGSITFLVTANFGIQLVVDFLSAGFVDKIGYRISAVIAHFCVVAGFVLLILLPDMMSVPFAGIMIAVTVYAVGGGLLEVIVSPIVEACPTDNKESVMSLLHSFYCWGHVAVVCVSTIYFTVFGIENWKALALVLAVIPLANGIIFVKVPIYKLVEDAGEGLGLKQIVSSGVFWVLVLMMACAGACEQAVSQWSSAFAEAGLGVDKTIGDLAGPMFFAVMMGSARVLYSKKAQKIKAEVFMGASAALCIASYLLISLSPLPALSLIGCGICGFSVGVMWPGTFSMASAVMRNGGTMMFAFLALAGDLGCSGGPTFVGWIAGKNGDSLQMGILAAVVFPAALIAGILVLRKMAARKI